MRSVYVFCADGFEEVEGLTAVDLLRRAGIDVKMVSIMGRLQITGSHNISVNRRYQGRSGYAFTAGWNAGNELFKGT